MPSPETVWSADERVDRCERSDENTTLDQQRSVQDRLCHEFLGAFLDTFLNYINRGTRQRLGGASVLELTTLCVSKVTNAASLPDATFIWHTRQPGQPSR